MRTITFVIERDPDSGWLVGSAVELPGLEANMEEAVRAYLAVAEPDCEQGA